MNGARESEPDELLDIVDEDGNPTGETVGREAAHRDGIRHRTSHVWLVRSGPGGRMQVLVQKRAADKDSFPGCWDVSSAGHIPAGEDWVTSALRELKEELGVEAGPEDLQWLGKHTVNHDGDFHGRPFHNRQVSAVFVLRCQKPAEEFKIQKSEIESVEWTDIDDCIEVVRKHVLPNCISLDEIRWIKKKVWVYSPGKGPFRGRGYSVLKRLSVGTFLSGITGFAEGACSWSIPSPWSNWLGMVVFVQLAMVPVIAIAWGALLPRTYPSKPSAADIIALLLMLAFGIWISWTACFFAGWAVWPPQSLG